MNPNHVWADQALALALQRLPEASTVLDVGAGPGLHSAAFLAAGHRVTGLDIHPMPLAVKPNPAGPVRIRWVQATSFQWMELDLVDAPFDLVWSSHFLEHVPDVGACLAKMRSLTAPDGMLAITVPPLKHGIVGGHLSLWNLGLLAYRLILAGFDCSTASFGAYGYNLSAIVEPFPAVILDGLVQDGGDIETLAPYFPPEWHVRQGFDGLNVPAVNWR